MAGGRARERRAGAGARPRSSSVQRVGEYIQFTVVAPGIADRARARAVRRRRGRRREHRDAAAPRVRALRRDAVGRLRRHGPVRRRRARPGHPVAGRSAGRATSLDLVGPLGTPFPLPAGPSPAVLVGGGYGAAPLIPLAQALLDERLAGRVRASARRPPAGCSASWRPSALVGAGHRHHRRRHRPGAQGLVTDVLPEAIERIGAEVVYACGPMPMLRAVGDGRPRARDPRPRSRSRSRWPAASGCA